MKSKELSGHPESSQSHPVPDQPESEIPDCRQGPTEPRSTRETRVVHYGDPDYYDHLPPHLEYLKELPFADGAFDFYPPSYEIEIANGSSNDSDTLDANQAKIESSMD